MRKLVILASILTVLYSCGPKQEEVERFMEDGVEVIVNHLEPYKIQGEPSNLILEEEFIFDTEIDEIIEIGLTDIWNFDVDSGRNIYFINNTRTVENIIFKFNRDGNFITSFARYGQGPGDIQFVRYFKINNRDEIIISDHTNRKMLFYSKDGSLIKETRYSTDMMGMFSVFPLENENYISTWYRVPEPNENYFSKGYSLCDSKYKEIKVLDVYKEPNPNKIGRKVLPVNPVFLWKISQGNIYIGNEDRGYEILVYDLEGNLLRKIKKEYIPLEVPKELKKKRRKDFENHTQKKLIFSKHWPPFNSFILDDEGKLYVRTYEKGGNPGEYIYDIFNSDGIFIGRKNLGNIYGFPTYIKAKIRNNHFYCLREKESGYKELVVYRMRWE